MKCWVNIEFDIQRVLKARSVLYFERKLTTKRYLDQLNKVFSQNNLFGTGLELSFNPILYRLSLNDSCSNPIICPQISFGADTARAYSAFLKVKISRFCLKTKISKPAKIAEGNPRNSLA
jgi:hypothetical protein